MQIIRFISKDNRVYTGCEYKDGRASIMEGNIFQGMNDIGKRVDVCSLLSPIEPSAVFGIGLNYRRHAKETGMALPKYPIVFMKSPSSVTGHNCDIEIPISCQAKPEVDFEAELAVIIGKKAKNVRIEKALDHIFGYTCSNDISARRWQKHAGGGQWIKGKNFDTFCPMGPWIVTADEIVNPQNLHIECLLNGEVMQKSNTQDMIFSVAEIISYLSESATLLPGTVILTGTPSGVGYTRTPRVFLSPGDVLETTIKKIGTLKNLIVME